MTDASTTALSADALTGLYQSSQPSAHLHWWELRCHDGTPYPPMWEARAVRLASEFEAIREACGHHPLFVLSAYRTESWNLRCQGSKASQHLLGNALDLQVRAGWDEPRMFRVVREVALRTVNGQKVSAIRGIGRYPGKGFIHVDIRESPTLAIWWGHHAHYLPRR